MASPGWYPDPAGRPGAFRFWDGSAWSAELTDNPYSLPPGVAPPPPTPAPPAQTPPAQAPPGTIPAPVFGTDPTSDSSTDTATDAATDAATDEAEQPAAGLPPSMPPPPPLPPGFQTAAGSPVPAQPAPPWAGQPSAPVWSPTAPQAAGSGGGTAVRAVLLVLLAIVAALALAVASFLVVEALTDDGPDSVAGLGTAADGSDLPSIEPASPVPTSDPGLPVEPVQPDAGTDDRFAGSQPPSAEQCLGGSPLQGATRRQGRFLVGGGLRLANPPGFSDDLDQAPVFTFADAVIASAQVIERTETSGWVALYALGALSKDNGFTDPQQAAETVLDCMVATDTFYQDFVGRDVLGARAVEVRGAPGWEIDAEIRIDSPELQVTGDRVKVIVVDLGNAERLGLFVSVVPIGDDALISQQQDYGSRLRRE